jgi:hypothetical protein
MHSFARETVSRQPGAELECFHRKPAVTVALLSHQNPKCKSFAIKSVVSGGGAKIHQKAHLRTVALGKQQKKQQKNTWSAIRPRSMA